MFVVLPARHLSTGKRNAAGHYISRSHYSTRWNEDNIFPQCVSCNVFKTGNYPVYAEYLDEKFGIDYKKKLRLLGAVWGTGQQAMARRTN